MHDTTSTLPLTREIQLTQGRVAIVDEADYAELSQYKWYTQNSGHTGYAKRMTSKSLGRPHLVRMHRVILDAPHDMQVDHINGDGLDNRRSNLRLCTNAENQHNRRKFKNTASKYKGLAFFSGPKMWGALIKIAGHKQWLGYFATEAEAAQAYDTAAIAQFGEFACLNFPKGE